jgi:hypothetical protein
VPRAAPALDPDRVEQKIDRTAQRAVVLGFEPIQVVALGRDQSHNGHERGDRMALTVKRPGAARGLEGQAAIGTRPGSS